MRRADAKLWWQKWRWYERNALPWNRVALYREFARRRAFARWPLHGDALQAFRDGRLEIGEHTVLEPHVWLAAPAPARIRIGAGTSLNVATMVAAVELVEIGDHCMFANGAVTTDIPPFSVSAGAPARVLRTISYDAPEHEPASDLA